MPQVALFLSEGDLNTFLKKKNTVLKASKDFQRTRRGAFFKETKEPNGGGSLKNKRGHQTGLYSNRHLAGGLHQTRQENPPAGEAR
jgi:hypothetical protein